jgi:hypothetical protein
MQAEAAGVRVRGSRPQLDRARRSLPGLARKPKAAAAVSCPCPPWPASDWAEMGLARVLPGRTEVGRAFGSAQTEGGFF